MSIDNKTRSRKVIFGKRNNSKGFVLIIILHVIKFPKDNFPGAGFIVDGHLLKGNTKFAGEVSFLPFGRLR
jgi:predicted NBD/HSP70 family sugar kinase